MIQGYVKKIESDQVELETPTQQRVWIQAKRIATPYQLGDVLIEDEKTGEFHFDKAATEERIQNLKILNDQFFN